MVWIKGPRCGIDNCSSRFYQVIGGRRVCQNGHVQEGLELGGDDDDFVALGHRITRPRGPKRVNDSASASLIAHGKDARDLVLDLLQRLLQLQTRWLQRHLRLAPHFESVVRELWAAYVSLVGSSGRHKYALENLSLIHLTSLCYLATRIVNVPVLLCDFHRWIREFAFPYMESWRLLPPEKFTRIPAEQRRHFRPGSEPGGFVLHKTARQVRNKMLRRFPKLKIPEVDERYAAFRLCRDLMLPPQVYVAAIRLLASVDRRRLQTEDTAVSAFEEIPAFCAVIMATKLYYGLDGVPRVLPEERVGEQANWEVWRDFMRKTWMLHPEWGHVDERQVQFWAPHEIDSYLDWYRGYMTEAGGMDKRLGQMFPYPAQADAEPHTMPYADGETLGELGALLNSTFEPDERAGNDSGLAPGSLYQVYHVRNDAATEIPELIALLYALVARFLATDDMHIRILVRLYERSVRTQHRNIISSRASTTASAERGKVKSDA